MRKLLLFLLVSIALPALAQNGKKVYADFHVAAVRFLPA